MSFKKNEIQEFNLFDPVYALSDNLQKRLDHSWASHFYKEIFCAIDEQIYAVLFEDTTDGRPNVPINFIVGSLILKEVNSLSDKELIDNVAFNLQFRRALGCSSLETPVLSNRTLTRFRTRLASYELEHHTNLMQQTFYAIKEHLKAMMKISPLTKRMDSAMIESNIKGMSRLELLYICAQNVVKELEKEGLAIPDQLVHYQKVTDLNQVIYHEKGDDISNRYKTVLKDLELIRSTLPESLLKNTNVQLMNRAIEEQTISTEGAPLSLRSNKEISPHSLQNPNDPAATYRKKAGKDHKGYITNFVEIVDDDKTLLDDYDTQINSYSDSQFAKDTLKKNGIRKEKEKLLTDGAYGGYDNFTLAKEHNVDLITGNLMGRPSRTSETDAQFILDESEQAIRYCPKGFTPMKQSYNEETETITAHFERSLCANCPLYDHCRAKLQKKKSVVRISRKIIETARLRNKMGTKEYKKSMCKRNGIEGIPSILRRKYQIDKMPVRGVVRTQPFIACKYTAINFKKYMKWVEEKDIA